MEPAAGDFFRVLDIRFSFQDGQNRQNGRAHWRFDEHGAKLLLFTPLNQVGLEMEVAGESALLLRPGRPFYWRGEFRSLLDRLWGIDLSLWELKGLVSEGRIPRQKAEASGMSIELDIDPASRAPRTVTVRRQGTAVTLRIIRNERRTGRVVLLDRVRGREPAGLEEVLADD
jgi:outer membrane biogenesis lipoprotein LolB